ncbi:TPA: 3'-5' exoribonuclease [Escherichia coli]
MNHLMVDLETMGNGPYAPVISIGAVFFDPNTGETGEEFSVNISLESSMRYRARPDASTILWWMEQSEEARKSLTSNTQELSTALSWLTPDGWISCSERMPEMGERQCYVLAADFKNNYPPNIPNTQVGVYGDWFNDGNPTWDDGDGEDLYLKEVTHWMPLPEPPQEAK